MSFAGAITRSFLGFLNGIFWSGLGLVLVYSYLTPSEPPEHRCDACTTTPAADQRELVHGSFAAQVKVEEDDDQEARAKHPLRDPRGARRRPTSAKRHA